MWHRFFFKYNTFCSENQATRWRKGGGGGSVARDTMRMLAVATCLATRQEINTIQIMKQGTYITTPSQTSSSPQLLAISFPPREADKSTLRVVLFSI